MENSEKPKEMNYLPLLCYESFRKGIMAFEYYLAVADTSLELYIYPYPKNLEIIKEKLFPGEDGDRIWKNSSVAFNEYFSKSISPQNQIFILVIANQWDWFINQMGIFIGFASYFYSDIKRSKSLENLHMGGLQHQIDTIQESTHLNLNFDHKSLDNLFEFFEVRHLGVHNAWQVDSNYLRKSKLNRFSKHQIRLINFDELLTWSIDIYSIAKTIAITLAEEYPNALPPK
jgi:hypothetical protein